jgi:hypothetical protein
MPESMRLATAEELERFPDDDVPGLSCTLGSILN